MDTFENRKAAFMEEYKVLHDKYQVDFVSVPHFFPAENGSWELRVMPELLDISETGLPSPFIAKE